MFWITYAICSTSKFPCTMIMISNFKTSFASLFSIFFYKYNRFLHFHMISAALLLITLCFFFLILVISIAWSFNDFFMINATVAVYWKYFFSILTYTHVKFEQLHKYIQKRNKIYKKWYTQKQSLHIKLFVISRKQKKKKQKRDVSSKSIESFIIVVVMSCRD